MGQEGDRRDGTLHHDQGLIGKVRTGAGKREPSPGEEEQKQPSAGASSGSEPDPVGKADVAAAMAREGAAIIEKTMVARTRRSSTLASQTSHELLQWEGSSHPRQKLRLGQQLPWALLLRPCKALGTFDPAGPIRPSGAQP